MTPEELLKPRFLLTNDYPGNNREVGSISIEIHTAEYFRKYKANFRELEWWEERDIKDMPGYIRFYEPLPQGFKIGKVSKWEVGNQRCIVTSDVDSVRRELSIADLPATESEYNEYIKSKA